MLNDNELHFHLSLSGNWSALKIHSANKHMHAHSKSNWQRENGRAENMYMQNVQSSENWRRVMEQEIKLATE
jgi:formamidopyrimidine-DNA glycosylase